MKIILKITMICGLLVSVFGTVEAARKYAPGVAMRMALKGDFDQSESEQILAAIPEEWKKEHRAIVRQMIQGTRSRRSKDKKQSKTEESSEEKTSTTDDKEKRVETHKDMVDLNVKTPIDEQLQKSYDMNTLLLNMKSKLRYLMVYRYEKMSRFYKSKDFVSTKFTLKDFTIELASYTDDCQSVINAFNTFATMIFNDKDKYYNSVNRNDIKKALESAFIVLNVLIKLKSEDYTNEVCSHIVSEFKNWYEYRIANFFNDNDKLGTLYEFKDFEELLETANKKFS